MKTQTPLYRSIGINGWRQLLLMMTLVLAMVSCEPRPKVKPQNLPDDWIILNSTEASKANGFLIWEFELKKPGRYNLQVLSNGIVSIPLPELNVKIEGVEIEEPPKTIFVLDSATAPKTIFQFNRFITLKEKGPQTVKITANSSIDQIRIIPSYRHKLGFGSERYKKEWLAMHNSREKQETLEWFKEAKYGMFIHWGLYSQTGGMWKGKRINDSPYPGPRPAEWLMHAFRIPREEYAELAKTFNPDKSFAANIAKLAKDAGMKYVVITSKHHDGFALFDSKSSEYDMVDATPYAADAIKELYDACLQEGLKFGVYYSHGNDWYDGSDGRYAQVKVKNDSLGVLTHPLGKNLWDPSPNTHAAYVEGKGYSQVSELVQMMPELALVWFDGEGYITEEQSFEFYKIIYDLNPSVLVNRRIGFDFGDYLDAGDNVIPSASDKLTKYWETCGTTNNSWAYKSYDDDWKSTPELIYYLIDIASKGGNYLLNIGPDGKGHVPEPSAQGLLEVGDWLEINGEAIYGTTRWVTPNEGQDETQLAGTGHRAKVGFARSFSSDDFWFTTKKNKVYVISLADPEERITVKSLIPENGKVKAVNRLGSAKPVTWTQGVKGLNVEMSSHDKRSMGFVLEVTLENESDLN
ncbi:hypothetical protein FNH22_23410 [Fulvivirga sp. M361]|uniref:alpha-L-fucosidase n=1 Tax=Fulvivirga sp. M361 TaxID=2594266 RepID=UPI00117B5447|nr:alpha-L-fucosidase [Fulvivirga sp. M361]TRX51904.1 hypothetical protein FNH22_23410 [Fulvivirga sp. M361]